MQPTDSNQNATITPWGEPAVQTPAAQQPQAMPQAQAPAAQQPQPQMMNQPQQPQPQMMNQPQQPQPQMMNQAPQPMMMGTVNAQMNQQFSPYGVPINHPQAYKKIHANDWFIMGILSIVFGFMGPGICMVISIIGAISMATKLNIGTDSPGHPEAEKVKSALIVNIIAIILPIIMMVFMLSIGYY